MLDYALLFGLFPNENLNYITENSINEIQNAANALQWCFVKGVTHNLDNVEIFNFPYLGSYPKYYKKIVYYPKHSISNFNNTFLHDYSFLNLPLLKHYFIRNKAVKELGKWADRINHDKIIVVYALYPPFLSAALAIKKRNPNVKICVIVPDLPEGMNERKNILFQYFKKVFYGDVAKTCRKIDYFVLLSKYMKGYFNCLENQYTVIEGMYDKENENQFISNKKEQLSNTIIKTIVYSGSLSQRYGVLNLLYAFMALNNKNYRLIICGMGDASDRIIEAANKDFRIKYLGQISHKEVLALIANATLLVNPRTNEGDYTKYSFPSKTMEFLASGTPTLLYKLDGIPDEYYEYCYYINGFQGINHLAVKIDELLMKNESELYEMGRKARHFILQKKNPLVQCEKMIDLVKQIK